VGIEALAAAVVGQFLVPFLSKGADALADSLTATLGDAASSQVGKTAAKLWARVRSAFSAQEQPTLDQFEERPQVAAPLVEAMLTDKLAADPGLVKELEGLLAEHPQGGNTSIGTIMADYVGLVVANAATINAPVTGLVVNRPERPSEPGG
jgi:hypothetical protein